LRNVQSRKTLGGLAQWGDLPPENDGGSELEQTDGLGGPVRKEGPYEAIQVLGGTDRVGNSIGRSGHPGQ